MSSSLNWIPPRAAEQEAGSHVSPVHTETCGWDGLESHGGVWPAGQGRDQVTGREEVLPLWLLEPDEVSEKLPSLMFLRGITPPHISLIQLALLFLDF